MVFESVGQDCDQAAEPVSAPPGIFSTNTRRLARGAKAISRKPAPRGPHQNLPVGRWRFSWWIAARAPLLPSARSARSAVSKSRAWRLPSIQRFTAILTGGRCESAFQGSETGNSGAGERRVVPRRGRWRVMMRNQVTIDGQQLPSCSAACTGNLLVKLWTGRPLQPRSRPETPGVLDYALARSIRMASTMARR